MKAVWTTKRIPLGDLFLGGDSILLFAAISGSGPPDGYPT